MIVKEKKNIKRNKEHIHGCIYCYSIVSNCFFIQAKHPPQVLSSVPFVLMFFKTGTVVTLAVCLLMTATTEAEKTNGQAKTNLEMDLQSALARAKIYCAGLPDKLDKIVNAYGTNSREYQFAIGTKSVCDKNFGVPANNKWTEAIRILQEAGHVLQHQQPPTTTTIDTTNGDDVTGDDVIRQQSLSYLFDPQPRSSTSPSRPRPPRSQ